MRWVKRGILIEPPKGIEWARTHAALPTPQLLEDGRVRVYFSSRDGAGRAHIARTDVNVIDGPRSVVIDSRPVLAPGPLGTFDDSGVTTSCLLQHAGRIYLYYSGWSLGTTVPFYIFAGCAISDDGGLSFNRMSPAPILERTAVDPYLTASPFVLVEGGIWRMWYVSGTGWEMADGKPKHYYHIKYAESADGARWRTGGHVCIDYRDAGEHAIARPYVIKDGGLYRMWYSYRGEAYRIGYAESSDGLSWKRKDDQAGIDVSDDGWDSEMVAYPCVFELEGRSHMLYNGNGYGATGIGHARLEASPEEGLQQVR